MPKQHAIEVIAIIPARGGSKRLPRKNVLPIGGKPLIAHSIDHAIQSRLVNRVLVSTDDEEIAAISRRHGAEVIRRSRKLATDNAASMPVLKHALRCLKKDDNYRPDLVVFLQCTSPVRRRNDIDNAVSAFMSQESDCLFSACRFKDYIWRVTDDKVVSINFDYRKEWWRGQDFPAQFISNGSIFVYRGAALEKAQSIFFGRLAIYEMDFLSSFQIDSPEDFELCRSIFKMIEREGQNR